MVAGTCWGRPAATQALRPDAAETVPAAVPQKTILRPGLSRSGSSGAALADVAEVALMALELGDVEPRAAVWADQLPERQP